MTMTKTTASGEGPSGEQRPSDSDSTHSLLARLKTAARFLVGQWMIIGIGVVCVLAYFFPHVAAHGGTIRSEYSILYGAVAVIFLISGLSIAGKKLLVHAGNWRLHCVVQGASFALCPVTMYAFVQAIDAGDTAGKIDRTVLVGFLLTACIPTTIASNVVMTRAADGDEAAALVEVLLGNVFGPVISPAFTVALLPKGASFDMWKDVSGDLNDMYKNVFKLLGLTLQTLSTETVVLIVFFNIGIYLFWTIICFACARVPEAWAHHTKGIVRRFDKPETIAICFCGPAKTAGLGIPLVYAMWTEFPTEIKAKLSIPVIFIRNIVFLLFLLRWTRKAIYQLKGRGIIGSTVDFYIATRRILYGYFLRLPGVRTKVKSQVSEAITKLEAKLVPTGPGVDRHVRLPQEGWGEDRVREELTKLSDMAHTRWEDGRVSGAVYHGGDELVKLQTEAFGKFTVSNPIHPDVFPAVRKMEAEVVAMVLSLFNAPEDAAGCSTSGGTESILMACLSARNKAYAERGVTEPEMILPETAHTAFRKAGEYFKIKVHLVACKAPAYKVDLRAVSRLVNPNTVLLVGSAPNFPHGIIDDITGLSRIAQRKSIPLHVDCCLGSFLVPYLEKAGFETEAFDFRLKGVTSISCDTHKYGFAPKGNSTVLYRTDALRSYQYFISPDWSGGVYASPSIAGSRPGALIAGCWASLMAQGESGYVSACHKIVGAAKRIEGELRGNPALAADLKVIGKPLVSVVAFTSNVLDIYDIADGMSARGWHLNALQNPPAIHVAVTLPIVAAADQLITDLVDVVEGVREAERKRLAEGKGAKGAVKGDAAALYGVAGSLPNKSVVVDLAKGFLDTLYKA
ncbi:Dihydrosphingosine phosphate lyase [Diplodia seriata]|uniref:sphinganine-1-phosphate aldolase n=1 Tax=Diplodia seriata TaxID=420778 RepID=A0ABR3CIS7_9PEZI